MIIPIFAISVANGFSRSGGHCIKGKGEEKKQKEARNYVEKQISGMHTQHPGTPGNRRGRHRTA